MISMGIQDITILMRLRMENNVTNQQIILKVEDNILGMVAIQPVNNQDYYDLELEIPLELLGDSKIITIDY